MESVEFEAASVDEFERNAVFGRNFTEFIVVVYFFFPFALSRVNETENLRVERHVLVVDNFFEFYEATAGTELEIFFDFLVKEYHLQHDFGHNC